MIVFCSFSRETHREHPWGNTSLVSKLGAAGGNLYAAWTHWKLYKVRFGRSYIKLDSVEINADFNYKGSHFLPPRQNLTSKKFICLDPQI